MKKLLDLRTAVLVIVAALIIVLVTASTSLQKAERALVEAKAAPETLSVVVTNGSTGKSVELDCDLHLEDGADYNLALYSEGKVNISYGCSHVKPEVLPMQ